MFSNFKYGTPQNEIGEVVSVIAGSSADEIIANTQGKFVLANGVYSKAEYPDLSAKIGSIGAFQFTPRTSGTTSTIRSLTYGNGLFIYGAVGGILRTSTDGITWDSRTSGTTSTILALVYGNGTYLFTDGGIVRSSANGVTWTTRTTYSGISAAYNDGLFIVAGGSTNIITSTDLVTWTTRTLGGTFNTVAYGNNRYIVGGQTSTDGITWSTIAASPAIGTVWALLYHNGVFIAGTQQGSGATIRTTTDGASWTERSSVIGTVRSLAYGNGIYLAVSESSGAIATSTDAITWTVRSSGTTSALFSATYGNGRYIYGGVGGVLASSNTATQPEYSTLYDVSTQFYVPPYTTGSRTYTLPTYGSNSAPRFVNYVRAK